MNIYKDININFMSSFHSLLQFILHIYLLIKYRTPAGCAILITVLFNLCLIEVEKIDYSSLNKLTNS